jgi:ketosteroid isomerase-like protein
MAITRIIPALGVALGVIGCARGGTSLGVGDEDIAGLIRHVAEGNAALVRGDLDGYLAHIDPAEDFVLMAPFGGAPRHGFDRSDTYRESTAKFFRGSGTFEQEVVATYGTGPLVVLVTIERVRGEIGGLPEQEWALRVTQVYRRERDGWQLVHRHADPLANGISLEHAAEVTRGDPR